MDVRVRALGAQGDGVAAAPGGAPLFIAGALPGERVRIRPAGDRAELLEVLEASADRAAPPCPHFLACGGCALQHLASGAYHAFKAEQLALTLGRAGLHPEIAASFRAGPGERRRLSLHARRGSDGRPRLGLKGRRAWSVVDLEACPVTDPAIVSALPALRRLGGLLLLTPKSAPTLHVTATQTGLAVHVTGVESRRGGLSGDERAALAGAAAAAGLAQLSLEDEVLFQERPPLVFFGGVATVLPPGGFLQASARAEAFMAERAAALLGGAGRIADLFCGSGAFSLPLARQAAVVGYDAAAPAVAALRAAAGGALGLRGLEAEARDLFRRPVLADELRRFGGAVIDPPRAGALQQAHELARSGLRHLVYVSCNPQSFVRDALVLEAGGLRLLSLAPVDQFLWSPHMELVAEFQR